MVPTMGALHQGHASLFKIAHEHADVVVATIFVNPLQFNNSADFEKYPLQMDYDVQLLEEHGVHFLYAPTVDTMYDSGFSTSVSIDGITDLLEGASRPGHFSGVATVVTKLFRPADPMSLYLVKRFPAVRCHSTISRRSRHADSTHHGANYSRERWLGDV